MEPDEQNLALSQGLLGLGAGLLSGSFGHYGAFGPALGLGASGLQQGYGNAQKYLMEQQQLKMAKLNYDKQNALMDYGMKYLQGDPNFGGGQGMPQGVPGTSTSPYVNAPQPQQPGQPYNSQTALPRFATMMAMIKGDPSALLSANEQLYPKAVPVREGGAMNPVTSEITLPPMLKPVEGLAQRYNSQTKQYEYYKPVGSELVPQQAGTMAGATQKAKELNSFQNVPQASGATIPVWGSNVPGAPDQPASMQPAPQPAKSMTPVAPVKSDPWSMMPKLETPKGVGQSTYQKYSAENTASVAKSLIEKHSQIASDSNAKIAVNDQALSLIDQADTGPYAARISDVKSLLVSRFGIPESSFDNTPSATQALQKDLVNAATQKAKQQFGARITQSEVQLMLTRGAPNVDMTKAAMTYLISTDTAQQKYGLQQATDLGKYLQKGGDPTRFEAWYSNAFPMSNTLKSIELNKTQAKQTKPNSQPVPLQNSDGWKLHVDSEGRKAYVSPDGKHFKEVQ